MLGKLYHGKIQKIKPQRNGTEKQKNNMGTKLTKFDEYRLEREIDDIEVTIGTLELNLQWCKNQIAYIRTKLNNIQEKVE